MADGRRGGVVRESDRVPAALEFGPITSRRGARSAGRVAHTRTLRNASERAPSIHSTQTPPRHTLTHPNNLCARITRC
eukprot:2907447-Prymnesium_polylepis.2